MHSLLESITFSNSLRLECTPVISAVDKGKHLMESEGLLVALSDVLSLAAPARNSRHLRLPAGVLALDHIPRSLH
jgi:hypothetical protein